jgi:hypothetical protein
VTWKKIERNSTVFQIHKIQKMAQYDIKAAFEWLAHTVSGHTHIATFVSQNAPLIQKAILRRSRLDLDIAASVALFDVMCSGTAVYPSSIHALDLLKNMLIMFLDGVLKGTSTHLGPLYYDHSQVSGNHIRSIVNLGVFTSGGQNTDLEERSIGCFQRAYLDGTFAVPSDSTIDTIESVFEKMKCCYSFVDSTGNGVIRTMGCDGDKYIKHTATCVRDVAEMCNALLNGLCVTYDGFNPFSHCYIQDSFEYNLHKLAPKSKIVNFSVWAPNWDLCTPSFEETVFASFNEAADLFKVKCVKDSRAQ